MDEVFSDLDRLINVYKKHGLSPEAAVSKAQDFELEKLRLSLGKGYSFLSFTN
jgi:hypothetical protein